MAQGTLRVGGELSSGAENTDYLLDNADPRAECRFDALGDLFDARTIEYLTALGVTRGWSCWEVGAGGGSIAEWLAGAVAPTGSVLATDLDLRRLWATAVPGLTATRHDVVHYEVRLVPMTSCTLVCCLCIFPSGNGCSTRSSVRFGRAAGS